MTSPKTAQSKGEFIALMAMLTATAAFAIDSMLPALPQIAEQLTPDAPNNAQLVLSSFVFGMGAGTLVAGPMADAFGRRFTIMGGLIIYAIGAALVWAAPSLTTVLLARFLMGIGAAGPRVSVMAVVRDKYQGAEMAKLMSVVMMVFMIVPAIAPTVGALIMQASDWRMIFLSLSIFSIGGMVWFHFRQPETLPVAQRRPMKMGAILAAAKEVLATRVATTSIIVQTLAMTSLFAGLQMAVDIFDKSYGEAENFHLWFALIACVSASASLLNSALVGRFGMRRIVVTMLFLQILNCLALGVALTASMPPQIEFFFFLFWVSFTFGHISLVTGNVNAMAMQPLGHIAGSAASVIAAISTIGSAVLAAPIGLMGDGSAWPLAIGGTILAILAWLFALRLKR